MGFAGALSAVVFGGIGGGGGWFGWGGVIYFRFGLGVIAAGFYRVGKIVAVSKFFRGRGDQVGGRPIGGFEKTKWYY